MCWRIRLILSHLASLLSGHMRCKLLRSMFPTSVSLSVTWLRCANTAEQIEVLFGVETLVDPRNIILDMFSDVGGKRLQFGENVSTPHPPTAPVGKRRNVTCNVVERSRWDWSLISTTTWFPSVLWHCWLGHLASKIVPELAYNVSSGTLSLYTLTVQQEKFVAAKLQTNIMPISVGTERIEDKSYLTVTALVNKYVCQAVSEWAVS